MRNLDISQYFGQETTRRILERRISAGKVGGCFLFGGPKGVGKTTLALIFAQALVCEGRKTSPLAACGTCQPCRTIALGQQPDLRFIRPTKKQIRLGDITAERPKAHEFLMWLKTYPTQLSRKIVIFDNAEYLSRTTGNMLLKEYEEGSAYLVFILVSSYPYEILPTVLSRAEKVTFGLESPVRLAEYLQKHAQHDRISEIAELSYGRVALALFWVKNPSLLQRTRALVENAQEELGLSEYYSEMKKLYQEMFEANLELIEALQGEGAAVHGDLDEDTEQGKTFEKELRRVSVLQLFETLLALGISSPCRIRSSTKAFQLSPHVLDDLDTIQRMVEFNSNPDLLLSRLLVALRT